MCKTQFSVVLILLLIVTCSLSAPVKTAPDDNNGKKGAARDNYKDACNYVACHGGTNE